MEPIRHTLTARLQYLEMYREEVDRLVAMFQQSCAKVTISDSKYLYKTLDEMKEHVQSPVTDFDIRGENPGVRFLFNQTEMAKGPGQTTQTIIFNELRTEEITDTADALFYKVKDFLVTYQRPSFRKEFIAGAIILFAGVLWFGAHNSITDSQGRVTIGSPLPFCVCIVAFIFFLIVGIRVKNYLSLETRRNSAPFFVRNREEFLRHAVTASISTFVAGVIGYCLGRFLK